MDNMLTKKTIEVNIDYIWSWSLIPSKTKEGNVNTILSWSLCSYRGPKSKILLILSDFLLKYLSELLLFVFYLLRTLTIGSKWCQDWIETLDQLWLSFGICPWAETWASSHRRRGERRWSFARSSRGTWAWAASPSPATSGPAPSPSCVAAVFRQIPANKFIDIFFNYCFCCVCFLRWSSNRRLSLETLY